MALKIKTLKKKSSGPAQTSMQKSVAGEVGPEVNKTETPTVKDDTAGTLSSVDDQLALVHVEASVTVNLGNYESVRLGCSLSRYAHDTPEAIDSKFDQVKSWVEDKLSEMRAEVE